MQMDAAKDVRICHPTSHRSNHDMNLTSTCTSFYLTTRGSKVALARDFSYQPPPLVNGGLCTSWTPPTFLSQEARGNTADLSSDTHTKANPILRLPTPPDRHLREPLREWMVPVWHRSFFFFFIFHPSLTPPSLSLLFWFLFCH